jgi:hypothetical protein
MGARITVHPHPQTIFEKCEDEMRAMLIFVLLILFTCGDITYEAVVRGRNHRIGLHTFILLWVSLWLLLLSYFQFTLRCLQDANNTRAITLSIARDFQTHPF